LSTELQTEASKKSSKRIIEPVQNNPIEELKSAGVSIKMAVFHKPIRSVNGEPETEMHANGAKPSRTALMWATPHYLLLEQTIGKEKKIEHLLVPTANVAYARVL
jgi:hypothetical protein